MPANANPNDLSLTTMYSSLTGVVQLDLVAPFVMGFDPRSVISPGDVLRVSFSEPVNCAGPSFLVYLVQAPGPTVPAIGGISTVAENLIVQCAANVISVAIKPGTVPLIQLAGSSWFLLLIGVTDFVGNPVTTNILTTSPWYLYQKPGNVETALRFARLDPSSTSYAVTALELSGIVDLMNHGTYVVGTKQWDDVVAQIQHRVGGNVGIAPIRIDVVYFWFSAGPAPLCVCNLVIKPAKLPVQYENVILAFRKAYPALFTSNGAQSMDILPMSELDIVQAQQRSLDAQFLEQAANIKLIMQALGITAAPTKTKSPVPSLSPSRFPTFAPVHAPTERPTLRPTSKRPTPRPSRRPTQFPSAAPTLPTQHPSHSPSHTMPSKSPVFHPTATPTLTGQTYTPSESPSRFPTVAPVFSRPTQSPSGAPTSQPTGSPFATPSVAPVQAAPSSAPYASYLTKSPTSKRMNKPTLHPIKKTG